MKTLHHRLLFVLLLLVLTLGISAFAQITPSQDSYTDTSKATTNFGAATTLGVASSTASLQNTYIQLDLSSVPAGYTSANVAKATLKLYVNSVTTAGTFNVDFVNGTWSEKTITADLAPALGTTIASNVPVSSANVHDYILVDVTPALGDWLNGSQANDGIALVANSGLSASFDSKENTTQSHPAELDIVFTAGGTISGVTTASGSGLTGGGTSGTLNLSLQKTCSSKQVLQWNGSAWVCAAVGTGTISGVKAGTDLTGGGTSGAVILNLDTTKVPLLNAANNFTGNQTVKGSMTATAFSGDGSALVNVNASQFGGQPFTSFALQNAMNTFTAPQQFQNYISTLMALSGFPVVMGTNQSTTPGSVGISGVSYAGSGTPAMQGYGLNAAGVGVLGVGLSNSQTGAGFSGAGVWGDTGWSGNIGVLATADDGHALHAVNSSSFNTTLYLQNNETTVATAPVLWAYGKSFGGVCSFDVSGNFFCTGTKSAVVPVDEGTRKVALYAVESPENWFEDFGSGRLANGEATIGLEPTFAQTVNAASEYHVFLTPKGDCKGLYVANETPIGFEVHELGGGQSHVAFDYRIVARWKGYETIRLADKTKDFDLGKQMSMAKHPKPHPSTWRPIPAVPNSIRLPF